MAIEVSSESIPSTYSDTGFLKAFPSCSDQRDRNLRGHTLPLFLSEGADAGTGALDPFLIFPPKKWCKYALHHPLKLASVDEVLTCLASKTHWGVKMLNKSRLLPLLLTNLSRLPVPDTARYSSRTIFSQQLFTMNFMYTTTSQKF